MACCVSVFNASARGHDGCLRRLIENGARDIDRSDDILRTPLFYASRFGYLECIKILIANGADVNKCDRWDETPLHQATIYGRADCLEYLIDHGSGTTKININATDNIGETSLHIASANGHEDCVRILLYKGADTDILDNLNRKASDIAKTNVIKELIENYELFPIKCTEFD